MNAAQASRLARLLAEAVHPPTCPVTGRSYDAEELAGFGEARATGFRYDREHGVPDAPMMMRVRLSVPSMARDPELYIDPDGGLWTWSTLPVPAEDCDCCCSDTDRLYGGPAHCPRHGDGLRGIECYRSVTSIGWEIADQPTMLGAVLGLATNTRTWRRWAYVVHEGDPIRDVLAEYREHRAKAAA